MNGLVRSILRWTGGTSSAQNSEITRINIGKSWVEGRPIPCRRRPVHACARANTVSNIVAVANRSSLVAKITAHHQAGIETMTSTDFIVARNDPQQCRSIATQLPDAATLPGEALLVKVTRFAFTANNITYAVMGDQLKYWSLFPAPDGFGNIPVWGFGEVIASKHPTVPVGEMLFGYFPMATHLVIEAADVIKRSLRDAAAHRQGVSPVYNAYARVTGDPAFTGRDGDYQALLRPLFMLSFLVDDHLAENEFYGARRVLLSSASSKTAFGLAHLLHARAGLKVIGLTSAPNADFVNSLGCYHEVVTYDRVSSLPSDSPVALVDMAGNHGLGRKVALHFRG